MLDPADIPAQLAAAKERILLADQCVESLARTRRIMARCYPNWQLPKGNPFLDDGARAVFMSPERSRYVAEQRRMAKVIAARMLAKIQARDAAAAAPAMGRAA